MTKVRSARGELVDFDILKIKNQLKDSKGIEVKTKSNFLDKRLSKKIRQPKVINKGTIDKVATVKPVVETIVAPVTITKEVPSQIDQPLSKNK